MEEEFKWLFSDLETEDWTAVKNMNISCDIRRIVNKHVEYEGKLYDLSVNQRHLLHKALNGERHGFQTWSSGSKDNRVFNIRRNSPPTNAW